MVSQTDTGWLLDVSKDYVSNDIILLIKLIDGKVISFRQKLNERTFYILPKSYSAGEDLLHQLSRQDQLIKQIFWVEKYIDLHDKNKTQLIAVSLTNSQKDDRTDFKMLFQKLQDDSREKALYNIDLPDVLEYIYAKLKIPPTSKIKIEYDEDRLLSIERIDDSEEIMPPFLTLYIENLSERVPVNKDKKEQLRLIVKTNSKSTVTALEANGLSDPILISYMTKIDPDVIIFCGDNDAHLYSRNDTFFKEWSKHKVIIHSDNLMEEIELLKLAEKSKFGYLPLRLASKYGMMRLIDSRLTYELIQREFVIPSRMKTISKHHEQIRTLQDIVEMDKAGMLISPEIGIHENVAVLDFNDQYANLIINHNLSYETDSQNQMTILPSIANELIRGRVYLIKLKAHTDHENQCYCQIRLDTLKQILVCLYGTSASIWNRYSNVRVFEEINKLSRQILLKTKDIVQSAGFELIYADTDAVFLKKKDATQEDYEMIMSIIAKETGLDLNLEFHYKFLVLLHIEADEMLEAKKHYYGFTYGNQLVTRGIDTRRHDSPTFIKQFQSTLLSKLFECNSLTEVLTTGYENALLYITQSIDKIMNGEVQITDLVIEIWARAVSNVAENVSAATRISNDILFGNLDAFGTAFERVQRQTEELSRINVNNAKTIANTARETAAEFSVNRQREVL